MPIARAAATDPAAPKLPVVVETSRMMPSDIVDRGNRPSQPANENARAPGMRRTAAYEVKSRPATDGSHFLVGRKRRRLRWLIADPASLAADVDPSAPVRERGT